MSQETQSPRPGQATLAGWLIIGGSIILLISAWQRISGLTTLEVQEEFRTALAEPPLSSTGMTLTDLTQVVRIASMVAGAAATAAAILGFHALRRSTGARLALTGLAPVVMVAGFAVGGFFAPLIVAGVVMLWLAPTRHWFAGRPWSNPTPASRSGETKPDPFQHSTPERPDDDAAVGGPASYHGVSQAPPAEQTFAAPGSEPGTVATRPLPPYAADRGPGRGPRPGALVGACVLTWAMSSLVALMMGLTALAMLVARDELFDEFERQQPDFDYQGLARADLAVGAVVVAALVVVWCVAAIVLAALAFRGAAWARIALVVCSIATGVVCLAAAIANPLLIVVAIAAAVAAGLLLRRDVADWYARGAA